jgi:hypothetical protein
LKHRFIDFTRVKFYDVQKADYEFSSHSPTWNITSATSSELLFWMPRIHKMSSRGLSTPWKSFHRLHQSRILRGPEGRLWVLRAILLSETSLPRLRPSRFMDTLDAENEFAWRFDTLKYRLIDYTKVAF